MLLSLLVGGLEAASVAAIYPILSVAFDTGVGQENIILLVFGRVSDL